MEQLRQEKSGGAEATEELAGKHLWAGSEKKYVAQTRRCSEKKQLREEVPQRRGRSAKT